MAAFEQSVTVDAPTDKVWQLMLNPATWSQWFPGIDEIQGLSSVTAGTTFSWKGGNESGTATISEVNDQTGVIKVVISHEGKQTVHTFDLDKTGGLFGLGGNDTKVKYRREYDAPGGFLGEFVAGGNPADILSVKSTLQKIKNLAQQ